MILAKEFKGLVRGWLAFVNVGVDTLLSGCHILVSRSRVRSTHYFLLTKLRVIIHNFTPSAVRSYSGGTPHRGRKFPPHAGHTKEVHP
jgi:hypothetical protein